MSTLNPWILKNILGHKRMQLLYIVRAANGVILITTKKEYNGTY